MPQNAGVQVVVVPEADGAGRVRVLPDGAEPGAPEKVDDFEELLRPYGIVELQRTGRVALPRLERTAPRLRHVKGKAS